MYGLDFCILWFAINVINESLQYVPVTGQLIVTCLEKLVLQAMN